MSMQHPLVKGFFVKFLQAPNPKALLRLEECPWTLSGLQFRNFDPAHFILVSFRDLVIGRIGQDVDG